MGWKGPGGSMERGRRWAGDENEGGGARKLAVHHPSTLPLGFSHSLPVFSGSSYFLASLLVLKHSSIGREKSASSTVPPLFPCSSLLWKGRQESASHHWHPTPADVRGGGRQRVWGPAGLPCSFPLREHSQLASLFWWGE